MTSCRIIQLLAVVSLIGISKGQTDRIFCKVCSCPVVRGSGYIICTRGFPSLAHLRVGVKTGNYTLIVRSQYTFYNTLKDVIDRLFEETIVQQRIQSTYPSKLSSKSQETYITDRATYKTATPTSKSHISVVHEPVQPTSPTLRITTLYINTQIETLPVTHASPITTPNDVGTLARVTDPHTSSITTDGTQLESILLGTSTTKPPTQIETPPVTHASLITTPNDVSTLARVTDRHTSSITTDATQPYPILLDTSTTKPHTSNATAVSTAVVEGYSYSNITVGIGIAISLCIFIGLSVIIVKVSLSAYKHRGMERLARRPIYLGDRLQMYDL